MNPKSSVAKMKFVTDGGLGTKARLGLIVLQTDQTIEHEFANLFVQQDAVALYAARIPNDMKVTQATLRQTIRLDFASRPDRLSALFDAMGSVERRAARENEPATAAYTLAYCRFCYARLELGLRVAMCFLN